MVVMTASWSVVAMAVRWVENLGRKSVDTWVTLSVDLRAHHSAAQTAGNWVSRLVALTAHEMVVQ